MEHAREQTHLSGHHGWIRSRFDLAVVALLGITVMAIAWGAYKAEVAAKDADHYFNRSDETLSTAHKLAAVRWWERQPLASRPVSPFSGANPRYRNVFSARASALDARATAYLERAHHAENRGIDYTVVIVTLTVALFLFGITTQLSPPAARYALVATGILIVLGSFARFVDLSV